MPHRRSPRGYVRNVVLREGFRDHEQRETCCVTSSHRISELLRQEYGHVDMNLLCHEMGEVLEDTRGRGTLQ